MMKRTGKETTDRKVWTSGLSFEPKRKGTVPDTSAIPWLRIKRKARAGNRQPSGLGRH